MYNRVFLIGNVARDPELRYTAGGIPITRFSVAVNRPRGRDAEGPGEADFFNIVTWRRLAEVCKEYLKKGRPVSIEGRLQIRTFKGREGDDVTMSEVVADGMQMLGRREDRPGGTDADPAVTGERVLTGEPSMMAVEASGPEPVAGAVEEEIPF